MADVVDPKTRSRMMSGIRGKDTRPEMIVRRGLHAMGYRYRLHVKDLPGKPDLVFPKYKAVIFLHGCFWHGHDCHLFKWPATRPEFWKKKIESNRKRDHDVLSALENLGWRVLVVWECALKGKRRRNPDEILSKISDWLENEEYCDNIRGR